MIFKDESDDLDTEPSYSYDAELDDELIRRALSSPLFTQERQESANLRQTYNSHEESLLPAQSFFTRTSTVRPVYEPREELQKSHVLKVEELSRRKLTEDFEELTSFFQDSNVKTVYIIDDNDAKYPDTEIDDEHTRNSLTFSLYLQEREASTSLLQVYHSQMKKLVSTCKVNFSKYGETRRVWMSQKRKSNQELDNCQIRITFAKTREQLLAEAKSEILRHEYRADLAENNTCELKRQIDSQAVENWAYSNRSV